MPVTMVNRPEPASTGGSIFSALGPMLNTLGQAYAASKQQQPLSANPTLKAAGYQDPNLKTDLQFQSPGGIAQQIDFGKMATPQQLPQQPNPYASLLTNFSPWMR